MMTRRLHRTLGIILLLPFVGWSITGLIFFIKPGYSSAYQMLQPKTYALADSAAITPREDWLEFRYLRTVLGDHLLVRTNDGWQHLAASGDQRPLPDAEELQRLLHDAFSVDPERYGKVVHVDGVTAKTDSGVEISLDWNRLALRQQGRDTRFIDGLYRVHYLQWTGVASIDRALGIIGLLLLLTMTAVGARLAFGRAGTGIERRQRGR